MPSLADSHDWSATSTGAATHRLRLRRGYTLALLVGALVCVAAAVIGQLRFGSSLYLFTDIKDKPGAFQGSMTVVSGFLLVAGAVLLLRTGELLRRPPVDRAAGGFLAAGALLALLAFDEIAMLHEWIADKCSRMQLPRPFGIDHDLYVFAVYGLWALLAGWRMLPVLRRNRQVLPLLLAMVLLAVASEAVDFVPWDGLSLTQRTWLGPLEEGTKLLATLAGALSAHALLDGVERRQ